MARMIADGIRLHSIPITIIYWTDSANYQIVKYKSIHY